MASIHRSSPYPFLCPQCGCPTHGSATSAGRRSTYCEDCVGDRSIDDLPELLTDYVPAS